MAGCESSTKTAITKHSSAFSARPWSMCRACGSWHTACCPTTGTSSSGPRHDGEHSDFGHWLTLTHTQRWHAHYHDVGGGHLYQGRFNSFPVAQDDHSLRVFR